MAALLLEREAPVNAENQEYRTPLHVAAYYGQPGVARVLLQHGANRTVRDREGHTALELATSRGHDAVVAALR